MSKNYFVATTSGKPKVVSFFTHDDEIPESIEEAYALAVAQGGRIAIFRVPPIPGPWDREGLVGHRRHSEILKDLERTKDADRRFWLMEELADLNRMYLAAGRAAPLQSVAA